MAKISINIATGSLQQNDIVVGIDLGTTNSLVAVIHPFAVVGVLHQQLSSFVMR